jgi:lipoprotein-anchoring transpeptidase ErfK/SrfK
MIRRGYALALALVTLAGASAVAAAPGDPVVERTGMAAGVLSLQVDVSERRLYVREDGEVIRTYPIAVGRPENPTPRGSFRVRRIIWNPRWVPPDADWAKGKKARAPGDPKNPMGRVKMFFQEPDYYIHGTHEVDSLGEAESRGCIRMRNSDVIALARTVMQHGGATRTDGWFRRVLNRVTSTEQVYLSRPVSFTIRS